MQFSPLHHAVYLLHDAMLQLCNCGHRRIPGASSSHPFVVFTRIVSPPKNYVKKLCLTLLLPPPSPLLPPSFLPPLPPPRLQGSSSAAFPASRSTRVTVVDSLESMVRPSSSSAGSTTRSPSSVRTHVRLHGPPHTDESSRRDNPWKPPESVPERLSSTSVVSRAASLLQR